MQLSCLKNFTSHDQIIKLHFFKNVFNPVENVLQMVTIDIKKPGKNWQVLQIKKRDFRRGYFRSLQTVDGKLLLKFYSNVQKGPKNKYLKVKKVSFHSILSTGVPVCF